MDLRELFEAMMRRFEARPSVETVHQGHDLEWKLIQAPGMEPRIEQYGRPDPPVRHKFDTVDGFVDYVERYRDEQPRVFVHDKALEADFAYMQHREWVAYCPLDWSTEYVAMMTLFQGCSHRQLWQTLVGSLHGVLPPDLLMAIGRIRLTASRSQKKTIELTGVEANEGASSVTVTFADGQSQGQAEIGLDWRAQLPLWDAWRPAPSEEDGRGLYDIDLRMTVAAGEDGPEFRFHPRNLDDVYQQALRDVVTYVRDRLAEDTNQDGDPIPPIEVYQGKIQA